MILESTEFGRIEITTIPLSEAPGSDITGTYTASGRILVAVQDPKKGKDWYRVFTMEEDGSGRCLLFEGRIPQKQGANGIRWMCYADNRRVLLGDYVLECSPDLDHCRTSRLAEVIYPPEISRIPGLFLRWSEPLIAPDNEHICFSTLTGSGAFNFLGRLLRRKEAYVVEDLCVISTIHGLEPDKRHPGCYLQKIQRGGEVKQFIRGGRGLTLAGGGKSISESTLQMLDSEETAYITDTLGYEETAIFSPDELRAVCMSPRFSPKTDCGILGLIPLSGDFLTRGKYLNVLYQYAVAGVRSHRAGNIGPALIDVRRSRREGRAYQGVNLSDPKGRWVYYSPMSWHPDSTRALWNERTRLCEGEPECRLRRCRLLDIAPSAPVPPQKTPDREEIPYALPLSEALTATQPVLPLKLSGLCGTAETRVTDDGALETCYTGYSEDGATFYDGRILVKAPDNMFLPGETRIRGALRVHGEHNGQMELRLTLKSDQNFQVYPDFTPDENGLPESRGFAEYDGLRRELTQETWA